MKSRRSLVILGIALVLATGAGFVAFAVTQGGPGPAAVQPSPPLPPLDVGGGLVAGEVLAGSRDGLLRLSFSSDTASSLYSGGEIRKILRPRADSPGWFFLGAKGVLYSSDLASFEERNDGLPFKTYKKIVEGKKVFTREVMDLKDLETDPSGRMLITCTKDEVWYSADAGTSWTDLGSPSGTTGLKCVALAPYPGGSELAAWASHPIKGLFYRRLGSGSGWVQVTDGLYTMPTMKSSDEVADLVWVPAAGTVAGAAGSAEAAAGRVAGAAGSVGAADTAGKISGPGGRLYASDSFQEMIFSSELSSPKFSPLWSDGRDFGVAESLAPLADGSLRFVREGEVMRLQGPGPAVEDREATSLVRRAQALLGAGKLLALGWTEGGRPTGLNELWLLDPEGRGGLRLEAAGKNALYLQAGYVVNAASRAKNFAILANRGLNAFVVDLKDDYGKLRFEPRDPLVKSLAKVSNPLDIEALAAEAKAKGVWLIARIPVFKDDVMAKAAGGKYAVWDAAHNQPWQGMKKAKVEAAPPSGYDLKQPPIPGVPQPAPSAQQAPAPTTVLVPNGERWVDPYSEEVWAYDIALANEVVSRGFDEVQFDYIRFPTDGENLGDASYRWRDPGMDKESAIASFLAFARERIKAPISIDIYGANGWYRSGARTGQDVEMLARYVDVICPMFYPSHFEQGFLAQAPAVDRPWRIYRLGSLRNARIARGRVIVRPYVQAFYMGVSYDKTWYNPDYVAREVKGVIQGENLGMTFWNNVDRYDDIPFLAKAPDGTLIVRSASAPANAPYEAATQANPTTTGGAAAKAPAGAQATKTSTTQPGPVDTAGAGATGSAGSVAPSPAAAQPDEAPPPEDSSILN